MWVFLQKKSRDGVSARGAGGGGSGSGGESKRRFDAALHHLAAVAGDVLLRWSLHEWLWYFIGLSAVLVHKDVLTKEYLHVSAVD